MSKLLKLKQWITVADAAERLTMFAREQVTEADVLQFALDGQLLISINFITEAMAQYCVVRQIQAETEFSTPKSVGCEVEILKTTFLPDHVATDLLRVWYPIGKAHVVLSSRNVDRPVPITGVWDLAMVGSDIDYVKNQLMDLLGKQNIEPSLDDFVITNQANNEHLSMLRCEVKDQKIFYVPTFRIPEDAFLVIRTAELLDFQKRLLADENQCPQSPVDTYKPKNSHLLVIAALLELQTEEVAQARPSRKQDAIKTMIMERHNFRGLGKRTLDDVFANANRALAEAKKGS